MFLFKREGKPVENTGQTFRSFLRHGFRGHRATASDWEMHINTVFPEVRLKRTLEIRGADCQSLPTLNALPALWTGILYDERALAEAEQLCGDFTHDEVVALRQHIPRLAIQAPWRGGTLVPLARRLAEIAAGGLERRARLDADGKDERVHLAGLQALLDRGQCPADALLAAHPAGGVDLPALLAQTELR